MNKRLIKSFKIDRRLGSNIFGTPKSPSGEAPKTGSKFKRKSSYNEKLLEKQKVKYFYDVTDKYLRKVLGKIKTKKLTDKELDPNLAFFQILESRLDTTLKRANFSTKAGFARQLISHGHIRVNGKKQQVKSFLLKPDDVVTIVTDNPNLVRLAQKSFATCERAIPKERMQVDLKELRIKVLSLPKTLDSVKFNFHFDFVKFFSYFYK